MVTTLPSLSSGYQDAKGTETLSTEQEERYLKIIEHFSDPTYRLSEKDEELADQEKYWLTCECVLRYLRASKWVLSTAIQRLEDTLRWRREFGVDSLTPEHVEPEALTGKEIIFGYDVTGRPALYLLPSRQNTDDPTRQIQFTVWMLERCVELMDPGVETLSLMINFADRAKNPSFGTARKVLNILQSHYPERLGQSLIINVPFLVMAFLNLIFPFVDPLTREKIKFNPKVVEQNIFASEQVMVEWGGNIEFEYKHENYWPTLVRMCEERREKWFHSWRALGGNVGTSERDIKLHKDNNDEVQKDEGDTEE